jgi:anti-anti-sigma factor
MGVPRSISLPVGRARGDHLCWGYAEYDDFLHAAAAFLEEGRRAGEQLVFAGDPSSPDLVEDLAAWSAVADALGSGQLAVLPLSEAYEPMTDGEEVDVRGQVDAFRTMCQSAVADGYAGLRVAADLTALTESCQDWDRLVAYELAVDEMMSQHPATGLCGWRESRACRPGALSALHAYQHRHSGPVSFAVRRRGTVLHLSGEVDASVADDLTAVLAAARPTTAGPVDLDLSELDFIDVAGARALAPFCDGSGYPVRLVAPSPAVARCLELFGLPVEDRPAGSGA